MYDIIRFGVQFHTKILMRRYFVIFATLLVEKIKGKQ